MTRASGGMRRRADPGRRRTLEVLALTCAVALLLLVAGWLLYARSGLPLRGGL